MPQGSGLNKIELKQDLKTLFKSLENLTDKDDIDDKLYDGLANIIDKFVRSGKVLTTGTAAAQQGTIT